ncbi:MAG: class I adenylate-forming enzyme family protein [Beijerinckiaceae bacterium]
MSRASILNEPIEPFEQRMRSIESMPLPESLPRLLADAAAEAPNHIFCNFFELNRSFTYREFHASTEQLASSLHQRGIGRGTHVGLMLPNVPEFLIAWFALSRIGAVLVPINPAYTTREVAFVIETGDVEWLFVGASGLETLQQIESLDRLIPAERIIYCGEESQIYQTWNAVFKTDTSAAELPPVENVRSTDLASIAFTSGTTGFPKGCMLSHRFYTVIGLVNTYRDGRNFQRILTTMPLFYVDPRWQVLMAIYRRGTVFVATKPSASRLMDWVRKYQIQFCLFPEVATKQPPSPLDKEHELVRVTMYGITPDRHAEIEERYDFVARESYGMTEVGSVLFTPIEDPSTVGTGSCGRVCAFRETQIVDEDGNVVPPGELGELRVKGPGIYDGYYKNKSATNEAFKDGWFCTGDIFRRDERGYFYLKGRVKDMIRRANENIAAREIEAVLRMMPEVVEAAALPVPDPDRGEEVKVYVVLQPGLSADEVPPQLIIEHCERNLARFKIPRYVAYATDFPKTPSDRIAKHLIIKASADLRLGSYDRVDDCWR